VEVHAAAILMENSSNDGEVHQLETAQQVGGVGK
jgi:hypothetical protein